MSKLNQIIAIEKGIKSKSHSNISELYKAVQKPELFNGFAKTYEKVNETGEELPPEQHRVQYTTSEVLRGVERVVSELMEVTARKDWTNCSAKGTVVVDGKEIVKDAPVSYLLFLEKQLTDLRTFVASLPTLDGAYDWNVDKNDGLFKTIAVKSHRTKKEQRPIVLYDATPEHPAQTQLITEDVLVGHWNTVRQSGAMPITEKNLMLERTDKILRAVKEAREAANVQEETKSPLVGATVFSYILDKKEEKAS